MRVMAAVQHLAPAALALFALVQPDRNPNIGHIRQSERTGGRWGDDQGCERGDADLRQIETFAKLPQLLRDIDRRMSLEARADPLLGALDLESAGYDAAQIAQPGPALGQGTIAPIGRDLREKPQMDAFL